MDLTLIHVTKTQAQLIKEKFKIGHSTMFNLEYCLIIIESVA